LRWAAPHENVRPSHSLTGPLARFESLLRGPRIERKSRQFPLPRWKSSLARPRPSSSGPLRGPRKCEGESRQLSLAQEKSSRHGPRPSPLEGAHPTPRIRSIFLQCHCVSSRAAAAPFAPFDSFALAAPLFSRLPNFGSRGCALAPRLHFNFL